MQTRSCKTKHDLCRSRGTDEDKQLLRHTWISGVLSPVLPVLLLFLTCPQLWHAVCVCHFVCEQARYKSKAKDLLKSGCNELHRPDILTALYQSVLGSKVNSHRVVNHHNADLCQQTSRKLVLCWFKTHRR